MRSHSRRALLSSLGIALPFGLGARGGEDLDEPDRRGPTLRFRSFEEAVREAFADRARIEPDRAAEPAPAPLRRRIEVGDSDRVRTGLQGCHNDRPFAGFPAGRLRIVGARFGPGPVRGGVRLYVSAVDIVVTDGAAPGVSSRPLDFATLPPAPSFS